MRFGGAWLPGCDVPGTEQATEAYLVSIVPPIVRDWVQECMRLTPGIKRGDMFPCPFIDPAVRMSEMHYSGIIELAETPITPGLEKKTRQAALRM